MGINKFTFGYKQLNPEQKLAVDTIEGPVFVIAGPGTGKTQVLTLRIANILRLTDTAPDSILALTFTNSGVDSMSERLVEIVGPRAYRVGIYTFHGFCHSIIQSFPEVFSQLAGFKLASRLEQIIYKDDLRARKLYSFDEMITEVVGVLRKKKNFLRQLQEQYQYFLADEHQDANAAQNQLLKLLADYYDEPNLFIVGDEKQAIFQFQGASLENFNYFKKLYPRAKLIALTHSYRSTQPILDVAHSLIGGVPLKASNSQLPTSQIRVAVCADARAEQQFVAQEVKKLIAGGVMADEIAVIYRDNADAPAYVEALERAGVPVVVQSEADLLTDSTIRKLVVMLEAVHYFGDDRYLFPFLSLDFLVLDPLDVYQTKTYQALKQATGELGEIYKKLVVWRRASTNKNFSEFVSEIMEESGFLPYVLRQPEAEEKLAKVQSFYEEIKEQPKFMEFLEMLRQHELKLPSSVVVPKSGVRLLTAHKSKGLEFEHVFIVGAADRHFGTRRLPGSDDDAERRLFYVALTRARRSVTISYHKPKLPSRFIGEIKPALLEFIEPEIKPDIAAQLRPRGEPPSRLADKQYLAQLFLTRGMSVTDLNNYLSCPRKYFYQNLLRLPQAQQAYLIRGTETHAALKEFFDRYRAGKDSPVPEMIAGYVKFYKQWPREIENELSVRGVIFGTIKLNGKIDKWEKELERVVDYKTGRPKTRNHILGNNKATGSGDYWRQLVFYKILLEKFDPEKFHVERGLIDFIEPDEKGRYKQEEFELTKTDTKIVAELINQTADNILNLKFFANGCGRADCEHCQLYELTK